MARLRYDRSAQGLRPLAPARGLAQGLIVDLNGGSVFDREVRENTPQKMGPNGPSLQTLFVTSKDGSAASRGAVGKKRSGERRVSQKRAASFEFVENSHTASHLRKNSGRRGCRGSSTSSRRCMRLGRHRRD